MDFVPYVNVLMTGYGSHTITSFPNTLIFEVEGTGRTANESFRDGAYEQTITVNLAKQDASTLNLVEAMKNRRMRAITTDHKGVNKIYGLKNGVHTDYSVKSGSAKGEFNGYEVTMTGMEEYKAHFISNITSAGFLTEGLTYGCLLSSSGRPSSIGDLVSSCNVLQS